jgi:hypothetical protein
MDLPEFDIIYMGMLGMEQKAAVLSELLPIGLALTRHHVAKIKRRESGL